MLTMVHVIEFVMYIWNLVNRQQRNGSCGTGSSIEIGFLYMYTVSEDGLVLKNTYAFYIKYEYDYSVGT
jgi:hypothetical protein